MFLSVGWSTVLVDIIRLGFQNGLLCMVGAVWFSQKSHQSATSLAPFSPLQLFQQLTVQTTVCVSCTTASKIGQTYGLVRKWSQLIHNHLKSRNMIQYTSARLFSFHWCIYLYSTVNTPFTSLWIVEVGWFIQNIDNINTKSVSDQY